jgi:hypothetical protein
MSGYRICQPFEGMSDSESDVSFRVARFSCKIFSDIKARLLTTFVCRGYITPTPHHGGVEGPGQKNAEAPICHAPCNKPLYGYTFAPPHPLAPISFYRESPRGVRRKSRRTAPQIMHHYRRRQNGHDTCRTKPHGSRPFQCPSGAKHNDRYVLLCYPCFQCGELIPPLKLPNGGTARSRARVSRPSRSAFLPAPGEVYPFNAFHTRDAAAISVRPTPTALNTTIS